MSVTTTLDKQMFEDIVDAMLNAIQEEIDRTRAEKTAFDNFGSRVDEICDQVSQSGAGVCSAPLDSKDATIIQPQPQTTRSRPNITAEIREAYESTVMSLSYFDEEYGETYSESIREEFGPEIATLLLTAECLTPIAQDTLLTRINEASQQREEFLQGCKRERRSVENVTADLKSIHHSLCSYDQIAINQQDFGNLEAHRNYLRRLEDVCEEVTKERQVDIDRYRTEFEISPNEGDLPQYLYADLAYDYPMLYLCSTVSTELQEIRKQVEDAMTETLE
ncbi:DUF7260 family protein [Halobellus rubicundus]|uniref:DUF7260 domain-containing protein n=1 Tax=Halobellus rubicundus TaxID=2996466 RepID=A0ABD5MF06_9EURY